MAKTTLMTFRSILRTSKLVGLDSPCFIYQFANHETYGSLTNILFETIARGEIDAITSSITVSEIFVLPERSGNPFLIAEYEKVFQHLPHLKVESVNWPQARLASKLRATYPSLRTPDALQLSTALFAGCSLFLTNDKRLKRVREIPVKTLDEFVR